MLSIGGGVLIAYVLFQLLVTPMIASRAQRELAGELGERIDTAAALATGSASTGLGSTIGNFGDLDLEHPQIPDLVGQLPSDAEAQLVELGFTVTRAPEQSRELVPGLVTRTDPPTDARTPAPRSRSSSRLWPPARRSPRSPSTPSGCRPSSSRGRPAPS